MNSVDSIFTDPVVVHTLATSLSVVFLVSGWHKLMDISVFAAIVENYRLLREDWVRWFTYLLPTMEVVCGVLLLSPNSVGLGGKIAFILLAMMTTAVVINLLRGHTNIECGCGGVSSQRLSWSLVARNMALMTVALFVTTRDIERSLSWVDYLTVSFGVLGFLGLYTVSNQLMANASMAFVSHKK